MTTPDPTLSVVLTVHNAEKTLAFQVAKLLDTLADLTERFELLIVDDGSTDQTEEIAHELARDFPQLRVARHPSRLGADEAAKIALQKTSGEILVLHEADPSLGALAIQRAVARSGAIGNQTSDVQDPRSPSGGAGGSLPRIVARLMARRSLGSEPSGESF